MFSTFGIFSCVQGETYGSGVEPKKEQNPARNQLYVQVCRKPAGWSIKLLDMMTISFYHQPAANQFGQSNQSLLQCKL